MSRGCSEAAAVDFGARFHAQPRRPYGPLPVILNRISDSGRRGIDVYRFFDLEFGHFGHLLTDWFAKSAAIRLD